MEGIDTQAGERADSVAKKYLSNLDYLLSALSQCSVHYIRCFNPNQVKKPGVFDTKNVLEQVENCGTVELVTIMHHGFPNRIELKELNHRFRGLLPKEMVDNYSPREFVHAIMLAFEIDESQWILGTKRLFLKSGQLRILENMHDQGCAASQEMISKIRKLFSMKKLRAAVKAISLVRWLPGHMRAIRRIRLAEKLSKAMFIYVRLQRWLRAVRTRMYGVTSAAGVSRTDVALQDLGLVVPIPLADRQGTVGRAELFITLNRYDARSRADRQSTKSTHNGLSESVLFYDGESIFSARFCRRDTGSWSDLRGPKMDVLSDVRILDISALNFGCRALASPKDSCVRQQVPVVAMCQHKDERETFATCDVAGNVSIWRWLGTTCDEATRPAMLKLGRVVIQGRYLVLGMTFLSVAHGDVLGQDDFIVALLVAQRDTGSMRVNAYAVNRNGSHRQVMCHRIEKEKEKTAKENTCQLHVSFFKMSYSEKILCIGGLAMLQFYAIKSVEGKLALSLITDCAAEFSPIQAGHMVSCLGLDPVDGKGQRQNTTLDWIVVGDSKGQMYGFAFDSVDGSPITMNSSKSGRYRSNIHDGGIPVSTLLQSYTSNAAPLVAEHQASTDDGSVQMLEDLKAQGRSFFSLADNGYLLAWVLQSGTGSWSPKGESHLTQCCAGVKGSHTVPSDTSCQFVAGHASRLVPNMIILADSDSKMLLCYDQNANSVDAACTWA